MSPMTTCNPQSSPSKRDTPADPLQRASLAPAVDKSLAKAPGVHQEEFGHTLQGASRGGLPMKQTNSTRSASQRWRNVRPLHSLHRPVEGATGNTRFGAFPLEGMERSHAQEAELQSKPSKLPTRGRLCPQQSEKGQSEARAAPSPPRRHQRLQRSSEHRGLGYHW